MAILSAALVLVNHHPASGEDAKSVATGLDAMGARTLQSIPASAAGAADARWIAWDHGFGPGQAVTLALCKATECTWRQDWPGAYEPTIRSVGSWSTAQQSVFLLLFSEGAEAETAIVLGRRRNGPPVILDRLDAAAIAFSERLDRLEVDISSGLPEQWRCDRWDRARRHLTPTPCR